MQYTVRDIAEKYGVAPNTVYHWTSKGYLMSSLGSVGRYRALLFSDEDLEAFNDSFHTRLSIGLNGLMSTRDVAERYGVSMKTVWGWIENGKLHGTMFSPTVGYGFAESDLKAFEERIANSGKASRIVPNSTTDLYFRFINGEDAAYSSLLDWFHRHCRNYTKRIFEAEGIEVDPVEYDDVVEAGVHAMILGLIRYKKERPCPVSTYLALKANAIMKLKAKKLMDISKAWKEVSEGETELTESTDDIVERLLEYSKVKRFMELLTPRERRVLDIRYGLTSGIGKTLEETAKAIGLTTRERIRQIENKALRKLRAMLEQEESVMCS